MIRPPPRSTLFPYTTLSRSHRVRGRNRKIPNHPRRGPLGELKSSCQSSVLDRKSTRLNSSHGYISYAVFCLKKKKKHAKITHGLDDINSKQYTRLTHR